MCVLYVWTLCASRIRLGWAHNVFFVVARHMMLHCSCICAFFIYSGTIYWLVLFYFSLSLSLSLSLSRIVCAMAPKRKSILSQNPLRSGASSSDSTPLHVRFHDEKACKDFSENFSKRGIHSKCHVILLDFSDTTLLTVTYRRGWESLCEMPMSFPFMIIQEFYSNMHGFDLFVP